MSTIEDTLSHMRQNPRDVRVILLRVDTPRRAASSSYRRKPVSRGPDWIPCQARNDGPEQKTIPRDLLRGSSFSAKYATIILANVAKGVAVIEFIKPRGKAIQG